MNYSVSNEANREKAVQKNRSLETTVDRIKNNEGLAMLTQGQIITGTVVSVEEQLILDFDGLRVTTSKDLLKNAVPGERKTFEVIKASKSEIELKLLGGNVNTLRQTIKAIKVKETDWETIRAQKEQATKQSEKEKATQEALGKLEEISIKFTEQDYKALEMEGFSVETMSIHGLYEAINRIKSEKAQPEQKSLEQTVGSNANKIKEAELIARLKEENLPVTKQNMDRVNKALVLSDTVIKIDDKAMKYLISQGVEPTIKNIYKAYYSGSAKYQEKTETLTGQEWSQLENQVKAVIDEAGYEVNQENLSEARWILENKLPLTAETFTYKKELGKIKSNADTEMILDRIIEGMRSGTAPEDVTLASQSASDLQRLISNVNSISDAAVTYVVQEKLELTIKKLTTVQAEIAAGKITVVVASGEEATTMKTAVTDLGSKETERIITDNLDSLDPATTDVSGKEDAVSQEYEDVKAQRQLEEIRLKMTMEAAGRLEKKGIHIETERLEKVVEELRRLEDSYYKKLLSEADIEGTTEALETLRTTTQSVEQLKHMPCAVLASTLSERSTQSIPGLLSSSTRLQAEYAKAGTAYETLATVPNPEYGDSIRKAFANMDSLLKELGIEHTEANQRAVRILGYNQMEITQETIDQVKAYDKEVTTLIQNLHPAVTVRMIKEGINPLNLPIKELNSVIDKMKEEQGITTEDKFSNYLHKLEKESAITPEERKTYIGVYRLLYNVEKSDGAALGAVIKADREVTLSHLLTAVQTDKKGRLLATIDDEFGMMAELNRNKESIAEQLNGFHNLSDAMVDEASEEQVQIEEQVKYLDRVLRQIVDEISPEKLGLLQQEAQQIGRSTTATQTGFLQSMPTLAEDQGMWGAIKNVPIERLLEQLQNKAETEDASSGYTQKVQQIRELGKTSEQSIRFLNDYQMNSSSQNIQIANQILGNGISPIVRLLKRQNENSSEKLENKLKELNELSDTIIDKSSVNEAYESLEAQAKQTLELACSQETLDSSKLAELRNINKQMTFLRGLASKEFYQIPIETTKGITNMNLTILRSSEASGRVSVTVKSQELGDIRAEFSLKDQTLKGFIACDSRNGLNRLQAQAEVIKNAVEESNINLKQLDFGVSIREKDNYSYRHLETEEQNRSTGNETERALYRLAKAMVQMVRYAEDSE